MRWKQIRYFILSFIILLVSISCYELQKYYHSGIKGNVVSIQEKLRISKYINKNLTVQDKKGIIIVVNESICDQYLFSVYNMVSELNSNYLHIVFNSKSVQYIRPLNKIFSKVRDLEKTNYFIDTNCEFTEIFPFQGGPLILYFENSKIVAGKYLQSNNYEEIIDNFILIVSG
jgi:hypothetical protein